MACGNYSEITFCLPHWALLSGSGLPQLLQVRKSMPTPMESKSMKTRASGI